MHFSNNGIQKIHIMSLIEKVISTFPNRSIQQSFQLSAICWYSMKHFLSLARTLCISFQKLEISKLFTLICLVWTKLISFSANNEANKKLVILTMNIKNFKFRLTCVNFKSCKSEDAENCKHPTKTLHLQFMLWVTQVLL